MIKMLENKKCIDFHAHPVTDAFRTTMEELGIDPIAEDGFPLPNWSTEDHLVFMNVREERAHKKLRDIAVIEAEAQQQVTTVRRRLMSVSEVRVVAYEPFNRPWLSAGPLLLSIK